MNRPKNGKTILLVEDNADNQIIYRRALEHFGYGVLDAVDGEEGTRLALEHLPDLVLMDISIPRMDGWQATKQLLADDRTKHIPIIALTAHALPSDRARGAEIGFASYLTKPAEPRRVIAEIERVLAKRELPKPERQNLSADAAD